MYTWPATAWPGLVDRGRAGLDRHVVDADRGPRLERDHRLDEVRPLEHRASLMVRVRQRERADLLDHCGRIARCDARDLVAPLRTVELLGVRDLLDVQLEDVEAVLLRRRPEPDVAAHSARTRQRGVERSIGTFVAPMK